MRNKRQRRQYGGSVTTTAPIKIPNKVKKKVAPIVRSVKVDPITPAKNIPEENNDIILSKVSELKNKGYAPTPNSLMGTLREAQIAQNPNKPINQREQFLQLMADRDKYANPARVLPVTVSDYTASPYVIPRPGLPNDLPQEYGYRNSITMCTSHEPTTGRLAGSQPVQW